MSNNSDDFWGIVKFLFFGGLIVLALMWVFESGPFEKSYTPSPTIQSYGSNPSFTGSGDNNSEGYKCTELGTDPQWRCKCKHPWMDINNGPVCPYCTHRTVYHHN